MYVHGYGDGYMAVYYLVCRYVCTNAHVYVGAERGREQVAILLQGDDVETTVD